MVKIVDMVATPEERFRSLRRLRPRFPKPESLTLIPWPKYVQSLVSLGMWEHVVARFVNLGFPDTVRECEACLEELTALEKEEIRRALSGENYKSLWESKPGDWAEPDGGPGGRRRRLRTTTPSTSSFALSMIFCARCAGTSS